MEPPPRRTLHGLGVLASTWSCIAWGGFALATIPWIVPADSIGPAVTKAEQQAAAGGLLALLALCGVPLYGGAFGRGLPARIVAAALAAAALLAGVPLHFGSTGAPAALGWRAAHLALTALFSGTTLLSETALSSGTAAPPASPTVGRRAPPNG